MNSGKNGLYITLGAIALVIALGFGWYASTYNTIVQLDETCKRAVGDIDSVLQRRFDLIPNLVSSVKGAMKHEKDVLTEVTEARAKVSQMNINMKDALGDPAMMKKFMDAQNQLGQSLSRLLVTVEKYPDLKAVAAVRDLMTQLEGTENRINRARTIYNETVANFNSKVRGFFGSMVAGKMGISGVKEPFAAPKEAKEAPKVKFE